MFDLLILGGVPKEAAINETHFKIIEVLGSKVRLEIVIALYHSDISAVDIAAMFDMSIAGARKHIYILERTGLITRKKVGRRNFCILNKDLLHEISAWPQLLDVSWLDMLTLEGR